MRFVVNKKQEGRTFTTINFNGVPKFCLICAHSNSKKLKDKIILKKYPKVPFRIEPTFNDFEEEVHLDDTIDTQINGPTISKIRELERRADQMQGDSSQSLIQVHMVFFGLPFVMFGSQIPKSYAQCILSQIAHQKLEYNKERFQVFWLCQKDYLEACEWNLKPQDEKIFCKTSIQNILSSAENLKYMDQIFNRFEAIYSVLNHFLHHSKQKGIIKGVSLTKNLRPETLAFFIFETILKAAYLGRFSFQKYMVAPMYIIPLIIMHLFDLELDSPEMKGVFEEHGNLISVPSSLLIAEAKTIRDYSWKD